MAKVRPPQVEIPSNLDPQLRQFAEGVKAYVDQLQGNTNAPLDRVPTLAELEEAGLIQTSVKNKFASIRASDSLGALGVGGTTVIVAGSGTGSGGVTPPPGGGVVEAPTTPAGLTASGAFTNIILGWTAPTYLGHDYTKIYRSATNNRAAAVPVGSTSANVYADPVGTNKTFYYWITFVNRGGDEGPFNAGLTAGVQGVTAFINEADLAVASISTAKLQDGLLSIAKFAATIRPVEVLATLPTTGNVVGRTVYLTTVDGAFAAGKVYRWTGTEWTAAVAAVDVTGQLTDAQIAALDAAKLTGQITTTQISDDAITTPKLSAGAVTAAEIAAGAVVAGKLAAGAVTAGTIAAGAVTAGTIAADAVTAGTIAAGAVNAREIAAGAIRTDKLAVGMGGAALNDDPAFQDATAWKYGAETGSTPVVFITSADSPVGNTYIRQNDASGIAIITSRRVIPVDALRTYRVRLWMRKVSVFSTTVSYNGVQLLDANGANISGDGSFWYYPWPGTAPQFGWTEYVSAPFGAGTTKPFPANARFMSPLVYINAPPGVAGSTDVTGVTIEEVLPATLIQDGAITTDKLAANAVDASKIRANTITAGSAIIADGAILRAKIADAAIDDAKIANLSAVKITAGQLDADRIAIDGVTIDTVPGPGGKVLAIKALAITDAYIANGAISNAKIGSLNVEKLVGDTSKFVVASNSSGITLNTSGISYVEALQWDLPATVHPSGHRVYVTATVQTMNAAVLPYPPSNPYGNFVEAEIEMRVTYAEIISGVEQPEEELGYQIADLRRSNRTIVSAGYPAVTTNPVRLRVYVRNVFSSSNNKVHVVRTDGNAMGLR